ncbi:MAG: hypothetical protein AAFO83_06760, partial [Cyanobacteria bacterium J06607_13]
MVTSQKDQIQSLIADIERVLGAEKPRTPWIRASETESQRQALERAQRYLISLQQAFEAPGGWGPVDPSTGQIAPQREPTFTPAAPSATSPAAAGSGGRPAGGESADNVLQALLTEMKFLKSSALEPLRLEMDNLRGERDRLNQEVKSLAEQRHQASLEQASLEQAIERAREASASLDSEQRNPEIDEQQLNEFLQALMVRLQENLSRQVTQTLGQLESDHAAAIAKLSAATEQEMLQLQPRKQIEDMRQLQMRSDQLLVNIDSTLQGMFETLQQNINSYQISLNEGIENMHSLGRQGEVIVRSLVDHLTQQLGQTAPPEPAFFPPRPTALAEPSSAEPSEASAESTASATTADGSAADTPVETVSSLNEILPATAAPSEGQNAPIAEAESATAMTADSADNPEDCIREDGTIDLDLLKLDIDRSEDDPDVSRDDLMIDAAIADARVAEAEADSEIEAKVIPTPEAAFLSDLTLDDLTVDSSFASEPEPAVEDSQPEELPTEELPAEELSARGLPADIQAEDAAAQPEAMDEPMDQIYTEAVQSEATQDLLAAPETGLAGAAIMGAAMTSAAVTGASADESNASEEGITALPDIGLTTDVSNEASETAPPVLSADDSVAVIDEADVIDEAVVAEDETTDQPAAGATEPGADAELTAAEDVVEETAEDVHDPADRPESAYIPDAPEDTLENFEEDAASDSAIDAEAEDENALPSELRSSLETDNQTAKEQALTIPDRDLDDLTSDLEEAVVFESDFNADAVTIEPLSELSPPLESAAIPDEPSENDETQLAESLEDILLNLENEIGETNAAEGDLAGDASGEDNSEQFYNAAESGLTADEALADGSLPADELSAGHSLTPTELPPEDFDDDLDFYSDGGSSRPEPETVLEAPEAPAADAGADSSEADSSEADSSEAVEMLDSATESTAPEATDLGSADLPTVGAVGAVGASVAGMSAIAATAAPTLPNLPPLEAPDEANEAADLSVEEAVSRAVGDSADAADSATEKTEQPREPLQDDGEADPTGGEPADWFLGIDFGTTGLSAVLINQRGDQVYPLCWNVAGDNESNRFRLPAVMQVSTDATGAPVAGEVGPIGLQQEAPLLRSLKLMVKAGIPDAALETPLMQWTEQIALPLVDLQSAIADLFKTMTAEHMSCRAVGLQSQALRRALLDLRGVIVGYPTNWPDTYSFNIREAVLTAGLVDQPDQVFFIEESIAALLSALPIPTAENDSLENQPPGLYNCNWSGGTVVLSAGTTLTE